MIKKDSEKGQGAADLALLGTLVAIVVVVLLGWAGVSMPASGGTNPIEAAAEAGANAIESISAPNFAFSNNPEIETAIASLEASALSIQTNEVLVPQILDYQYRMIIKNVPWMDGTLLVEWNSGGPGQCRVGIENLKFDGVDFGDQVKSIECSAIAIWIAGKEIAQHVIDTLGGNSPSGALITRAATIPAFILEFVTTVSNPSLETEWLELIYGVFSAAGL